MLKTEDISEEYPVENLTIETPNGPRKVLKVYKTVPLKAVRVHTPSRSITCAADHLLRTFGVWKYARSFVPGETIDTEEGTDVVTEVESIPDQEMYDITVDDVSGEFYSNGFVSHNSTTLAARQLIFGHLIPEYSSQYVVGQHDQLSTYGDRLADMESRFRYGVGKQNKYSKKYANGSAVYLNYCLTTANSVRGRTVDETVLDECVSYDTLLFCHRKNLSVDIKTRICDICVGDLVMSADPNRNIKVYDRVIAKQFKGLRDCYKLRTASGRVIRATGNHRMFTDAGPLYVSDIRRRVQVCSGSCRGESLSGCIISDIKSSSSYDDFGYSAWGRLHIQHTRELVSKEIKSSPLLRSERLFSCKSSSSQRDGCEHEYSGKQWICQFICSSLYNEVISSTGHLLGYVLRESCHGQGWYYQNEEVCLPEMGGPAGLGSYSLVDSGRWEPIKLPSVNLDKLVQHTRSAKTNSLVCKSWSEEGSENGDVQECANRIIWSCDTLLNSSYTNSISENSSVCAYVDALQVIDRSYVQRSCVCTLRENVHDHGAALRIHAEIQPLLLPGLQFHGEERTEAEVQREIRSGRSTQKMERGKEDSVCKGSGSGQEVLRCSQGECLGSSKGKETGSSSWTGNNGSGRDMLYLRKKVQDESEDVCSAETIRNIRVLGCGLPEEERSTPGCKIACSKEGSSELIYEDIVQVEYCGTLPVYDITTENTHAFIANGMLVHNCQGIDPGIVPEMLYIQTTSKIPSTIYAGTSLTIDTLLESKWQSSSQGVWNIRAMDGTHWLNMHDQETLHKVCDNAKGPTCPYTGKLLNVADGCYIHENKQALAVGDVGVHVPQCIIPDLVYNPIQWGKIYKKVKTDDFKKVLQECFGIAVSEGSREISEQDLIRMCVLKDTQEELKKKCWNGYYRMIISGCDWGGSDYNPATKSKTSYTVHMIIGLAPDGAVDIIYGQRYSGMEYAEIAASIVNAHKNYNGKIIASDFGVGMAYNTEIRNRLPYDSHFIMSYVGPETPPISEPHNAHLMNQLSLNRTEAISKVYAAIKSTLPKVRCRNWEDMQTYLLDFLNMYRIPTELPNGKNGFRYMRSAQKADDALHAFCFAYNMMLFYMGIPMVSDLALERKIRDMMNGGQGGRTNTQQELHNHIYGDPQMVIFG